MDYPLRQWSYGGPWSISVMVAEEMKVAASAEMVTEGTNIFPLSGGAAAVPLRRPERRADSPDD